MARIDASKLETKERVVYINRVAKGGQRRPEVQLLRSDGGG